jgi:hypothetical protein
MRVYWAKLVLEIAGKFGLFPTDQAVKVNFSHFSLGKILLIEVVETRF